MVGCHCTEVATSTSSVKSAPTAVPMAAWRMITGRVEKRLNGGM